MKTVAVIAILGLFIVPPGFFGFYRWDSAKNRGSEFGYWGDFNRTKNALASIPGVTLTRKWHNLDVTLEEFGFEITTNGRPVNLSFGERDAVRNMSARRAIPILSGMIAKELTNGVPHHTVGRAIDQPSGKRREE